MRTPVLFLFLAACAPEVVQTVDTAAAFCDTLDDADGVWMEEVSDASANSGSLDLRVITDQADDPHDPLYVAYRAYSLEPAETGGVQTTGTTNGDGLVQKTLGIGTWDFQATWTRGAVTCTAIMNDGLIVEAQTTHACVVLTCPLN